MWEQFLNPLSFSNREIDLLVNLSEGFSGSDIQDVCVRLHRRKVVTREQPVLHDAFQALQNLSAGEGKERRFLAELKDCEPQEIATILRTRDPNRFSYGAISQLLGKSKQTAIRWVAEGGVTQNA
jgi:hypothetical protein